METGFPLMELERSDSVRIAVAGTWKTKSAYTDARKVSIRQLSRNYYRLLVTEDNGKENGPKGFVQHCWTAMYLNEPF
jgi:hypothetical protein